MEWCFPPALLHGRRVTERIDPLKKRQKIPFRPVMPRLDGVTGVRGTPRCRAPRRVAVENNESRVVSRLNCRRVRARYRYGPTAACARPYRGAPRLPPSGIARNLYEASEFAIDHQLEVVPVCRRQGIPQAAPEFRHLITIPKPADELSEGGR